MVGAILEDTPEAGAVWAAERVRGTLLASPIGDALTLSAGVACYPHARARCRRARAPGQRALDEARSAAATASSSPPRADNSRGRGRRRTNSSANAARTCVLAPIGIGA